MSKTLTMVTIMSLIVFGEAAQAAIWKNVLGHLDLIRRPPDPRVMNERDLRAAEINLLTFIVIAAWRHNPISDREYRNLFDRFRYLNDVNPDIFRVVYSDDDVVISMCKVAGGQNLHLGRVIGFTTVLPLTESGYRNYLQNRRLVTDLMERDIVSSPYRRHTIPFTLIAHAVWIPLLGELFGDRLRSLLARAELIGTLCDQLGRFYPPVRVCLKNGCYRVTAAYGRRLPVAVCPIRDREMGEQLLHKSGFRLQGRDGADDWTYTLDAQEIDDARLDITKVAVTRDRRVLEFGNGAIQSETEDTGSRVVAALTMLRLLQRYQRFRFIADPALS
jgi:hypothetical protein